MASSAGRKVSRASSARVTSCGAPKVEITEWGAEPPVVGFDVVVTDDDGRIAQVHGFLDVVPDL